MNQRYSVLWHLGDFMSCLVGFNQQPTDKGTSIINDISHLESLPVAACNEDSLCDYCLCLLLLTSWLFQMVFNVVYPMAPDQRRHVSINSARWLPDPGMGLAYGTNKGDLVICRPVWVIHNCVTMEISSQSTAFFPTACLIGFRHQASPWWETWMWISFGFWSHIYNMSESL